MQNLKKVKCPKCKFENIAGAKKCAKCRTKLDDGKKSCPKCAKINSDNVKRCVSCGFNFTKRRRTLLENAIVSVVIVVLLICLVTFGDNVLLEKYNIAIKAIFGFLIFVIIVKTFTYGENEKISYSAEEEILEEYRKFGSAKKTGNILILVGAILVILFLIYYYLIR